MVIHAVALVSLFALHPPQRAVIVPECTVASAPDSDRDGLSDQCELRLARLFAPLLVARSGGCNWDASADGPRLGGGYLFAVQPVDSVVRVAYLPAYFRDCGWRGLKCWAPWVNCAPHDGDSELVVVELLRSDLPDAWHVTALFLSAHCFGRSTRDCRWYRGAELERFRWQGPAPVVWVAEGRQANYPSWQRCDRGHHSLDTCDQHDTHFRFPVYEDRNLGSRAAPSFPEGCVPGHRVGLIGARSAARECFWNGDEPFRGWFPESAGVTPYARYFLEIVEI